MTYYYELVSHGCGIIECDSNEQAVSKLQKMIGDNLLVVYHESNTNSGKPFQIVYERDKK